MQNAVVLVTTLLVLGCAATDNTRAKFVPANQETATTRYTQHLKMSYADNVYDMLGVLETSVAKTSLAVLSTTGLVLFSIQQTRTSTKTTRHPDLPSYVDPQAILRDVQLVNWPTPALLRAIDPALQLSESPSERLVYLGERQQKRVSFTPSIGQWQLAILQDFVIGYSLEVRALATEIIVPAKQ